jgi:dipeptide/tripeptide permease
MAFRAPLLAIALVPFEVQAKSALPEYFLFYIGSLFVVIPVVALAMLLHIYLLWCRSRIDAVWMLAALAATLAGGLALWQVTTERVPLLSEGTWPLIYTALAPLVGIWLWVLQGRKPRA